MVEQLRHTGIERDHVLSVAYKLMTSNYRQQLPAWNLQWSAAPSALAHAFVVAHRLDKSCALGQYMQPKDPAKQICRGARADL